MFDNSLKICVQDLQEELEKFNTSRRKWREERMMRAIAENGEDPLTERQQRSLSGYVSEQNKLLIKALRHKMEGKGGRVCC